MIEIRPLGRADGPAFKALRLEGLRLASHAFSEAYADALRLSDEQFFACIPAAPPSALFGAFLDGVLVGVTGLKVHDGLKQRHTGMIWGVYVAQAGRGQGLARRLLNAAIAHARTVDGLEILQLGVGAANEPAKAVYGAAGFELYGVERKALRLEDGCYVDEELRMLDLRQV